MNNDQILKKRWNATDKLLSSYLIKYKSLNKYLQDDLQSIFDGIKWMPLDANKSVNVGQKNKLDRLYQKWKNSGILTPYFSYTIQRTLNKSNISNLEALTMLIEVAYLQQDKDLEENKLLDDIAAQTYAQGCEEAGSKPIKGVGLLLAALLLLPNKVTGYVWKEHKEGTLKYNADQIKQQVLINLQQKKKLDVDSIEFQNIINSQNNRYLNKKKDISVDKFSGSLDVEVSYIVNSVLMQAYLDSGVDKVRFIAVLDEATSKMCKSLDNQTFYINKENRFVRYSQGNNGNTHYKVIGLESGINLPPINDGFHYCRSTIIPE